MAAAPLELRAPGRVPGDFESPLHVDQIDEPEDPERLLCRVCGEPTQEQRNLWKATEAGFEAALSVVKAGALGSAIYNAMLEETRARGYPEHNGNFAGHAIGLEQREVPYILTNPFPQNSAFLPASSDFPLEAGTTLCIENPMQIFGMGGTQIEKTVIVTGTGYEFLCPQERKLWVTS